MRKPFLTVAKVIVALNIVFIACLIIATTTYPSTTLGGGEALIAPPVKTATTTPPPTPIAPNATIPPPVIAVEATNKTSCKHELQSSPTTTTVRADTLSRYYGVNPYSPQILVLILVLLLGVSSIALVSEFKTPRGRGYLENAFQTFKIAKTWYTVGLISVSILLAYTTIALTYLGYSLTIYLLLVFEAIALVFFTWRILHIYRLQDRLLKLIRR